MTKDLTNVAFTVGRLIGQVSVILDDPEMIKCLQDRGYSKFRLLDLFHSLTNLGEIFSCKEKYQELPPHTADDVK